MDILGMRREGDGSDLLRRGLVWFIQGVCGGDEGGLVKIGR
jgi:hypothetical protein